MLHLFPSFNFIFGSAYFGVRICHNYITFIYIYIYIVYRVGDTC
jgi:hypothetical protein